MDVKGIDLVTLAPINWNDYEPMSLNVLMNQYSTSYRETCYYETEIGLHELQGRTSTIQDRKQSRYKSFKMLMKCLLQEWIYPWVSEYWVYHSYALAIDFAIIQTIEKLVVRLCLENVMDYGHL